MALISCKDCKKEFSTDAKKCPHCGANKPRKIKSIWWFALAIIVWVWVFDKDNTTPDPSTTNYTSFDQVPREPDAIIVDATSAPDKGKWHVNEDKNEMTDHVDVYASLSANDSVAVWLKNVTPILTIRCQRNKTEILITNNTAAQPEYGRYEQATVELRLDENKAFRQLWSESTDNDALFASNAVGLAKQLYNAKKLKYGFTPFNSSPVITEFDLNGIKEVLPKIAERCNWKLN